MKREAYTARVSIAIPIALAVVIVVAGLWALLRETPEPRRSRPAVEVPAPVVSRPDPIPERPSGATRVEKERRTVVEPPVVIEEAQPEPPRQKRQRRAGRNRYTGPSELLAWIEATETIDDYGKKKIVLVELGKELAAENFDNALLLAGDVSDTVVKKWLYEGIFGLHALSNPAAALRAARELDPDRQGYSESQRLEKTKEYYTALLAVMGGWAATDPAAALAYVEEIPQRISGKAMISVYGVWAESDPGLALENAGEITGGIRAPVLAAVFSGWARHDPAAAASYAVGLDEPHLLPKIYNGIAKGFLATWNRQAPRATADWAAEIFPEEVLDHVLPDMYLRWAESDPMEAAQHALQLNRNYEIDIESTLGNVLKQWAESNLDQAVDWIDQTFPEDEDYIWAVSSLIDTMRYKNPGKTAELLEQVPFTYADGTPGATEVAKLMAFWCRKDPDAARAWAESIENWDLRVAAIESLAATWTSRKYDEALSWAQGISDPDMKAYALSEVAMRQAMQGMRRSSNWIKDLPSGFIQVRTATGFVLGALLRAKDDVSAELVKQQLAADALDVSRLNQIVRNSSLDGRAKDELIRLLN